MRLIKLKLTNYQLFENLELTFDKINFLIGKNFDVEDQKNIGSNGSGKTSIINAILFVLGIETGINQADLIHLGKKNAEVELELEKDGKSYLIRRSIPSSLYLAVDGQEIELNTATLKEKYIFDHICTKELFKEFRMVDTKKGTNVLDCGSVSLRKMLMSCLEGEFNTIRANLQATKLDRERFNVNKKLYTFTLSERRLDYLTGEEKKLLGILPQTENICQDQAKIINNLSGQISAREQMIYNKKKELVDSLNGGICPVLKKSCAELKKPISEETKKLVDQDINKWTKEIEELKEQKQVEEELQQRYSEDKEIIRKKGKKLETYIIKLTQAFKFAEYKYTAADVMEYSEAIKLFDEFAAYEINNWLQSLEEVINTLLLKVNISVKFSPDKQFLKVTNNGQELKWELLSGGQQTFLSIVFKMAIMLQKEMSGIILADEGYGNLDLVNLKNLLEVMKTIPFQLIGVYHNIETNLPDVKFITVTRRNNISQ
jgi:hypothetical protein